MSELLDLLVIGAGPHALSLLTRLITDDPDLLTERERVHIMHKAGSRARSHDEVKKELKKRYRAAEALPRTLVVDTHGRWMAQWASDFEALDIEHTRSNADLHPCPFDFQSLRVWAATQRREDEMYPMRHIDRDAARKRGYGGPFLLPGTHLFLDFCAELVERYELAPLVTQGTVAEVRLIEPSAEQPERLFGVHLADGRLLRARRVVCAMGPGPAFQGMRKTLPWWADELGAELAATSDVHARRRPAALPSSSPQAPVPPSPPPLGSAVDQLGAAAVDAQPSAVAATSASLSDAASDGLPPAPTSAHVPKTASDGLPPAPRPQQAMNLAATEAFAAAVAGGATKDAARESARAAGRAAYRSAQAAWKHQTRAAADATVATEGGMGEARGDDAEDGGGGGDTIAQQQAKLAELRRKVAAGEKLSGKMKRVLKKLEEAEVRWKAYEAASGAAGGDAEGGEEGDEGEAGGDDATGSAASAATPDHAADVHLSASDSFCMPPDACAREVPPSARLQHSSNLTDWLRASDTHTLLRGRRVLVVGGGQTSAHLALLALRRGATVTLTRPPPRISECLRRLPMASECLQRAFAVGR
jgi:hypothetical protein